MILSLLLSLLQLILIIVIILFEYKYKSTSIFMWATLFVMFGITHFLDVVIGSYRYSLEVMNEASVFVIIFCILYLISRLILVKTYQSKKTIEINFQELSYSKKEINIYTSFILIATIIFVIYTVKSYGGILNTSWNLLHSQNHSTNIYNTNDVLYLLYYFSAYIIYAFDGIVIYFALKRKIAPSMFVIVFNLFFVVVSRNRTNLLPILTCIIILLLLRYHRVNIKILIKGIVMGLVSLYIIFAIQVIRLSGSLENFITNFSIKSFNSELTLLLTDSNGELGLRNAFYYFINNYNNFPDFGQLKTYISLLLLPIPSSLTFGLKPNDFAITMGSAYLGNYSNTTFSMHPTLFGDSYANLGMLGVFLSFFWAIFVSILDKRISNTVYTNDKILYLVIVSSMFILIGRGSVYFACRMAFISSFLVWIVRYFVLNIYIYKKNIIYKRKRKA